MVIAAEKTVWLNSAQLLSCLGYLIAFVPFRIHQMDRKKKHKYGIVYRWKWSSWSEIRGPKISPLTVPKHPQNIQQHKLLSGGHRFLWRIPSRRDHWKIISQVIPKYWVKPLAFRWVTQKYMSFLLTDVPPLRPSLKFSLHLWKRLFFALEAANPPADGGSANRSRMISDNPLGLLLRVASQCLFINHWEKGRGYPLKVGSQKKKHGSWKLVIWRFPEIGLPPVLIHLRLGFSHMNLPFCRTPFQETSISPMTNIFQPRGSCCAPLVRSQFHYLAGTGDQSPRENSGEMSVAVGRKIASESVMSIDMLDSSSAPGRKRISHEPWMLMFQSFVLTHLIQLLKLRHESGHHVDMFN